MAIVGFETLLELETAFQAMVLFKFGGSERADIFVGSPVMASALETMLSAIEDGWGEAGYAGKASQWRDWATLSRSVGEHEQIAAYLVRHPEWDSMSRAEKLDWLRVVAAPYRLDDDGVARFDSLIGPAR
jgi:hypothetical protein